MRKILITFTVIFLGLASKAQVKGTLIDSASLKPIENAVIGLVVKSNPTDTSYTFTDTKGQFRFETVPTSAFSIVIRHLGYWPKAKYVPVTRVEKTIDVGSFVMAHDARLLSEVVLEVAPIVIKEDTIEYNASSFKVKEGAVVEDLLKKLPGVQVDKDGNVTAQGKAVSRVKVNGKDFFGGDVKTATKELPANIVDKIQIIDDYGDQATVSGIKDGEPDKVMNIQIKKDKNKGFFGRATAGYGTQDRYQASFNGNYFNNNTQISLLGNSNNTNTSLFNFGGGGNRGATSMMRTGMSAMSDMGGMGGMNNMMQSGNAAAFSGANNSGISTTNSFGFNYRDQWSKRISVYGSYSYNHKNNSQLQTSSSQNFYDTTSYINNQDVNNRTRGNSQRFTFNMEYQVDSFNYLKISPSVNFTGSDANNRTAFDYTEIGKGKTNDGTSRNLTNSKAPNLAATILYNHKFRKRGRNFSTSITLGTSQNNSEQDATNLSYRYQPFPGPHNTFQFIDQENNNYNYGVRFTYSEPLNKYQSLDFSYSHNLNYSRNDRKTFNVDSATKARTINNLLSNDYENEFYNNRIGLSLRTTRKKYNYTVGLSLQPVNLQGNSVTKDSAYKTIKRANVFPIARFVYNFNRTKSLNFSYNGNATQPSFSQLQPVPDVSNQQNITTGNPNLKPSLNHSMNLSFNNFNIVSGKILFTNFSFSTIRNQIVNNTINRGAGSQLSIPENVNGYYNLLGFYVYSRPYKNRKYVISVRGTANFNHNINLVDSIRNIGQNWVISQGFNFEYNYKEILELGTGISYSLNDVHYKNKTGKQLTTLQNTSTNAWTFSNNINLNITKTLVLKYDVDYTINTGLASSVSRNQVIMNASLEKQLFKKKNGIVKIEAFDLFKQNSNISRSVSQNSIIDSRTNRLTRYFIATFTYRLQRFAGQNVQAPGMNMRTMGAPRPGF
jgi:hypothetical protein